MIKLLKGLRPFRLGVAAVLILVFLQSMGDLYLPTLMSDIVDKGIVEGDRSYIWRIGGYMLLVAGGGALCSVIASYLSAKVAAGFGRNTRSRMFEHVENFTLHEFDKLGTASLITRTTNDITQVQTVLTMMLRMMVGAPMMMIGGLLWRYLRMPSCP